MILEALFIVNVRDGHSLAAPIIRKTTVGETVETIPGIITNDGFEWVQLATSGNWAALGVENGERFFKDITPAPIPDPTPQPVDCELQVTHILKKLETGHFLSESVSTVIQYNEDFYFDIFLMLKDEQLQIFVLAEGNDISKLRIRLKDETENED